MKYMIFKISCLILEDKKHFFFNFHFFKTVILGIFDFWLKTLNYKSCSKNIQNHQGEGYILLFHISQFFVIRK